MIHIEQELIEVRKDEKLNEESLKLFFSRPFVGLNESKRDAGTLHCCFL